MLDAIKAQGYKYSTLSAISVAVCDAVIPPQKDELIADYNRLVELDNQLCKLYDTIWGNTGCESGICPL